MEIKTIDQIDDSLRKKYLQSKIDKKVLAIIIEKKWYDNFLSGAQRETYLELKNSWTSKLTKHGFEVDISKMKLPEVKFKQFDFVAISRNFGSDTLICSFKKTTISIPKKDISPDHIRGVPHFSVNIDEVLFLIPKKEKK